MQWSKYFIPTLKEIPIGTEAISHQLLLRGGLVHMLTSGVYSYLPLGLRVLRNIEKIIREEMNAVGAQELFLPCLHPIDIWKKTGRDEVLDEVMIKFEDNRGRPMCLGPTHEEIITDLVKNFVQSYRQLPVMLYQIQTKFRDELRARFGIVRACEFIMKDAYSFDRDIEGLKKNYQLMYEAYQNIFKRLNLEVAILEADSGAMGGDVSHEFMVPAPIGEDTVVSCPACGMNSAPNEEYAQKKICPKCQKGTLETHVAIELGHIFQLGTKYSKALGAQFLDEDGQRKDIIMGCYGIGVSRVIAAIVEKHHDNKGIIWPKEVAPFDVEVLPLQSSQDDTEILGLANQYYQELTEAGLEVLVDDRDERPGKKFNDADLIGMPLRVTIGKRNLKEGKVELKLRAQDDMVLIDKGELKAKVFELLNI
ncbi:Prolyl-tRNA synthetase, bacterial type [hydrothermal vent metagenome]|uniref:proline--tRNA ligase n=1 Tax=hydrothermal vent metagenome TaxID=652676 RepID=A0A3B1DG85_9ZZZZ